MNGRTSWNSSIGAAVWFRYDYEGWFFGPMAGLGGLSPISIIALYTGNDSCFYNVSGDQWQYLSGAGSWTSVNDGDVSIQCLSGNIK